MGPIKILSQQRGVSLVEVLMSVTIISVSCYFFLDSTLSINKQSNRITNEQTLSSLRQDIISHLNNSDAWSNTINDSTNSNMICLKTTCSNDPTTACSGQTGGRIQLRDSNNEIVFNATDMNEGFTAAGESCDSYDGDNGDITCPFQFALSWRPLCNGGACSQMELSGQLSISPGVNNLEFTINPKQYAFKMYRDLASITISSPWTATATANAPTPRQGHQVFWTGSKMLIWGGTESGPTWVNTGGVYDLAGDSWATMTTTDALTPNMQAGASSIWTGSQMIIWGSSTSWPYSNAGSIYTLASNQWSEVDPNNAPDGRANHSAVWTGSRMLIWGGSLGVARTNTGGIYNPGGSSWSAMTTEGAPLPRQESSALWTGSKLFIWGGVDGTTYFNDGFLYDPTLNSWSTITSTNAPSVRHVSLIKLNGTDIIIYGGSNNLGAPNISDGKIYSLSSNTWSEISASGSGVETSTANVILGDFFYKWRGNSVGDRYSISGNSWSEMSSCSAPTLDKGNKFISTGSKLIIWGGQTTGGGGSFSNTGAVYDPANEP